MLLRVRAGFSPVVGSKARESASMPFMDLSTGAEEADEAEAASDFLPGDVVVGALFGATAENAATLAATERSNKQENFIVVVSQTHREKERDAGVRRPNETCKTSSLPVSLSLRPTIPRGSYK